MKILLDECIPRKFKKSLPVHYCLTAPEAGFAGRKNGLLLRLAEDNGFEVFLTLDKGIEYQQHLEGRRIAIMILRVASNRLADLIPLVPSCLRALATIHRGELVTLARD